jgi:hypothetical protein
MDTPACVKCGTAESMELEDSGPTYNTWRCTTCNTSRTKRTVLGKALPFATLGLGIILGLPDGGGPDIPSS